MAHVEDRWFRDVPGAGGKVTRIKTERHGTGLRWRARWIDPDSRERSQSFVRKTDAERRISEVEGDKLRGVYLDPRAGRVTLQEYAEEWFDGQTSDESTRENVALHLKVHVYPQLGGRQLAAIGPSTVRSWLRGLQERLAPSTIKVVFGTLSAVLSAAVEDGRIAKNPCKSPSVSLPAVDPRKVVPWTYETLESVRQGLTERYRILAAIGAGCGLRQGEAFGLAVEDVDFLGREVHVQRQVKVIRHKLVFALPKGHKTRTVPLPEQLAFDLSAYLREYPAAPVALPWSEPQGKAVAARLLVTNGQGQPLNRNHFNRDVWKPALRRAGVPDDRENGMHARRHWYASALLDGGESIKLVSEYLGHTDEGFTLRTYTHLMPTARTAPSRQSQRRGVSHT